MTDEKPEKPTTFTCIDCPEGVVHERKSMRGPVPRRCEEHKEALAKAKTTQRLNDLRQASGRPSIEDAEEAEAEALVENEIATENAPPSPVAERSWLDDQDAQDLLRAKREREAATGVPYNPDVHGTVSDYLAAREVEIAMEGVTEESVGTMLEDLAQREGITTEDFDTATDRVNELRDDHRHRVDEVDYTTPAAVCVVESCGMPNPPHVGAFCPGHWQQVSLEDRGVLLGCGQDSEIFADTVRRVLNRMR